MAAAFAVSVDGTLIWSNACLAALLGVASAGSLLGRRLTDLAISPKDWPAWRQSALEGRERGITVTFRRETPEQQVTLRGDLVPVFAGAPVKAASPSYLSGIFVDVTEQENLRRAVQRSARMEALGSLTSGIAHDFNNLLTVLVGNLYLAAEEQRNDASTFGKLKSARDAAKRGADLVRQLLAFARRESVELDVVDPAKVVDGLMPLLRRALGSRIELVCDSSPGAGTVRCNSAQLESVVVNLCVNARDAIESNGKVTVSVKPVHVDGASARKRAVAAGDYMRVAVADDGCGISGEAQTRVFEPFYTTKGERGGTGLGLSMVKWFAEQCGGAVALSSHVGKGTEVSLLLPSTADRAAESSTSTMPLSTLPGGNEKILVVSRDEALRVTIKQILEVLGYQVHLSGDPAQVPSSVAVSGIDLLLIDAAVLQGRALQQLAGDAQGVKPALRIVIATDHADAANARVGSGAALLTKPFTLAELAGTLRKALDRPAGTS